MTYAAVVVSLPTADRATSYAFYQEALGLEAIGELGDDGVPEPLQFVVNDGLRLMLVPHGGFGWVLGGADVAKGQHECLLAIDVATPADTDTLMQRALDAGAALVAASGQQPWGYAGTFADPDGHVWMVRASGG